MVKHWCGYVRVRLKLGGHVGPPLQKKIEFCFIETRLSYSFMVPNVLQWSF